MKGQEYLIKACQLLKQKNIKFSLHFVGDGPDEEQLKQLTNNLELTDHVTFYGRLPQLEISQLLQNTDVLVQPSVPTKNGRREGIPVVLMEAMSSSVPVISSQLSGIPELIENNHSGILVEPRDIEGIANALECYYNDPLLRKKHASNGLEKVRAEFDQSSNALTLFQLIKSMSNS